MPGELTVRSGRVKNAKRLATKSFRARTGEFLAEGPQAVREALAEGLALEVFATTHAEGRHLELRQAAATIVWNTVDDEVLAFIADSVSPQGIVARCRLPVAVLNDLLDRKPRLLVVCAEIRDPGNAGSVIRAADAAGADGVIFAGDCVDPFGPKSVRASVGSVFHLPIVVDRDTESVVERIRAHGLKVYAADGSSHLSVYNTPLTEPTAWLLGNEAWGLPEATRNLADQVVAIPIYGRAESLNLATAAALCLYASAQAHRADR